MKLAIFSPIQNAYSETFIQAHRKLSDNTLYYYGSTIPNMLEGYGELTKGWKHIRNYFGFLYLLCHFRLLLYPSNFSLRQRVLGESLRKNKVTHVLAEFGPCAAECMLICQHLNIKIIAHFHGYDISRRSDLEKYKERYLSLFAISHRIIAVSKLMKTNLMKMGCPENKILYCPCGPNDSFAAIYPKFDEDNILYVGRFADKKAPYDLILAFKNVLAQIPNAQLIMVGDGELFDCCRNLASYLEISNHIDFKGKMNQADIHTLFMQSTVYCQPSATAKSGDQEGTPVSVMEASLAGLPIVATKHAGIQDVVINGKTGILVNEHDVNGIANALVEILQDKRRAKEMGMKGKEFIKDNFVLSKSLDLLRSALS